MGLAGIYVNQHGREKHGIVGPGSETEGLLAELREKLTGLVDTDAGHVAIREVVARDDVYHGPYIDDAPDLIVGYDVGWDGVL